MKSVIIANLKMNLNSKQTFALVKNYIKLIKKPRNEVIVCASFTAIPKISELIKKSKLNLGAQDMFYEQKGAYTGEISGGMLREYGCKYAIIGHSEKRKYLKETDELANLKLKAAIMSGINPILCVGEDIDCRDKGESFSFVEKQLKSCVSGIDKRQIAKIVIAYEPIWAISTTANRRDITTRDITQMHNFIRKLLKDLYDMKIASNVRVIYGGSVNDQNIVEILKADNVDGVLVGAASLDARKFAKIVLASEKR